MTDTPTPAAPATVVPATVAVPAPVSEPQAVDQLPEWARTALTKANSEAAKYRTERNDAVNTVKTDLTAAFETQLAQVTAAHEATKADLAKAAVDMLKVQAALTADVPAASALEFASLLQGNTPEEITAHAAKVKALFGGVSAAPARTPAVDLSPSGDNNPLALNGDPLLESLKNKLGI
ncbi:hypothetical protein [Actinocrispum wychmicini]|uniref:Scaffolding protein n=1 Tax=Actinocrispum wychmicini TaxID=1213861 RepID=A0A4R2JBD6_9PSEU|nr:hypothetical protein [Actinocrispum wychmicini]TCO56791.1 hypothetical protein EV192_106266 [Actinocrispum wychmicini]